CSVIPRPKPPTPARCVSSPITRLKRKSSTPAPPLRSGTAMPRKPPRPASANTSSSTVVRFSQALGFEGFPELQAAAREEYRRVNAKPATNGDSTASTPLFSLDQNEFESALTADHLNVEDTARKVSRSSVEALIQAIVDAEKVLVAGTDQMAFFASYMRHLLMLLDLRVDVVASPSQEALSRLGR